MFKRDQSGEWGVYSKLRERLIGRPAREREHGSCEPLKTTAIVRAGRRASEESDGGVLSRSHMMCSLGLSPKAAGRLEIGE